jgi:hypothetical protein
MGHSQKNIGKLVEISANGFLYKGILKAITENEIYLKGSTKTWTISTETVRNIRVIGDPPPPKLNPNPLDLSVLEDKLPEGRDDK